MRVWRVLLALACFAALGGCATTPSQPFGDTEGLAADGSAYDGQATVYVLRDSSGSGALWSVNVSTDGVMHGSVRRESYVRFGIAPGRHDLLVAWPKLSGAAPDVAVNAEFRAGKTYYFVFSTSFDIHFNSSGGVMDVGATLRQVPDADAKGRMRTYSDRTPTSRG